MGMVYCSRRSRAAVMSPAQLSSAILASSSAKPMPASASTLAEAASKAKELSVSATLVSLSPNARTTAGAHRRGQPLAMS
jgi:hypothetical protein